MIMNGTTDYNLEPATIANENAQNILRLWWISSAGERKQKLHALQFS